MTITIKYVSEFIRSYNKLELDLQKEVLEKIQLFKKTENHKSLKTHKLHGRLRGRYGFSVNYKYRIIFEYIDKKTAVLLTIGDHDIYK